MPVPANRLISATTYEDPLHAPLAWGVCCRRWIVSAYDSRGRCGDCGRRPVIEEILWDEWDEEQKRQEGYHG